MNESAATCDSGARLRLSHLIVQPVLVWDDGADLTPGPLIQPVQMAAPDAALMISNLPEQLRRLEREARPQ